MGLVKNYTGYQPDTREYLTAQNEPQNIGLIYDTLIGRINTDTGWSIVDLKSKLIRDGKPTYVYELPILVVQKGYTTKTIIKYDKGNINEITDSLTAQADKLVLSLKT